MILESVALAGWTAFIINVMTTEDALFFDGERTLLATHATVWGIINGALTGITAAASPALASGLAIYVIYLSTRSAHALQVWYRKRAIRKAQEAENAKATVREGQAQEVVSGAAGRDNDAY